MLGAVLRQRHQLVEAAASGDEVANLVEQIAVVVPPHDERVEIDHLIPEVLRRRLDQRPESLEGVEQRTLACFRPASERVEQEGDVCRLRRGLPSNEGPHLRDAQVTLDAIPLRGDLTITLNRAAAGQDESFDEFGVGEGDASDVESGEQRR